MHYLIFKFSFNVKTFEKYHFYTHLIFNDFNSKRNSCILELKLHSIVIYEI